MTLRTVVVIPTYNERDTLPVTLARLRAAVPEAHVLVVDDGSPDGTGQIADELAAADSHVNVMHRTTKEGLGRAYVAGFTWALERGYEVIVEMDADGSHQPEQLVDLLARLVEPDTPSLVQGSRWVPGGSVVDWPLHRELLSRFGNTYVRLALGFKVKDATGGFRAYRATALEALGLSDVASAGYCFQVDMVWRVLKTGGTVVEVPIEFVERTAGDSKMSQKIVAEALWRVTVWGAAHRARQLAGIPRAVRRRSQALLRRS